MIERSIKVGASEAEDIFDAEEDGGAELCLGEWSKRFLSALGNDL